MAHTVREYAVARNFRHPERCKIVFGQIRTKKEARKTLAQTRRLDNTGGVSLAVAYGTGIVSRQIFYGNWRTEK